MCCKTRSGRRFRESCDGPNQNCSMLEQFHPRGVIMRDCLKNRAGYDRVLMAVAATFLTVSATSAVAQGDNQPRNGAAELAIDAAIPRPEPANVPPPTASDFKADTVTPASDAAKVTEKAPEKAPETKPADLATAPAAKADASKADAGKTDANVDTNKVDTNKSDTATVTPAQPPAAATATPAAEPVKA